jgi:hypothetical protein
MFVSWLLTNFLYTCSDRIQNAKEGSVLKDLHQIFDNSSGNPALKMVWELEPVLCNEPFSLETFQKKLESLLQGWNNSLFGHVGSVLVRAQYRIDEPRAQQASNAVNDTSVGKKKKKKRRHEESKVLLKEEPGDDEIMSVGKSLRDDEEAPKKNKRAFVDMSEESEDVSINLLQEERAKENKQGARGGGLYDRKKSAASITFEEDSDEEEQERIKLSEVPPNRTAPNSRKSDQNPMTYQGAVPDEGTYNEKGKVIKRRKWTDEESDAVKSGFRKHGHCYDKWVKIKEHYPEILKNRHHMQIKDKWRTMVSCGEAVDPESL